MLVASHVKLVQLNFENIASIQPIIVMDGLLKHVLHSFNNTNMDYVVSAHSKEGNKVDLTQSKKAIK